MRNRDKKENRNFIMTAFLIVLLMLTAIISAIIFRVQSIKRLGGPGADEPAVYDRYYAFIIDDDDSSFWNGVYEGARRYGEKTGAFVEEFASNLTEDLSPAERIRVAVACGVDGIIVENTDKKSVKKEIAAAAKAGIPVILTGSGDDDASTGRISFVGISRYDLGGVYGKQVTILAKKLLTDRDSVKITVLTGRDADEQSQKLLISTIRESIAKDSDLYGRIEFDIKEIEDRGTFASQKPVTDLLMSPDNVPDILVALNEDLTLSSYEAVIDNNVVGRCNIIGYYDSESIREAIENEVIYSTVSVDAAQMGEYCASALDEYIDTGYVSEYFMADSYAVDVDTVSSPALSDEETEVDQ